MDPIPSQPQPISPILQPPHRHFMNKKFAVVTIAILLCAGAGYGAVTWYTNQQSAQKVVATFTPRPTDSTANWKTYTNTQYGFEFKYPADWKIISSNQQIDTYTNDGVTLVAFRGAETEKNIASGNIDPGYSMDLRITYWKDFINSSASIAGGGYAGEPNYKNLNELMNDQNALTHAVGTTTVTGQQWYDVSIGGAGSNPGYITEHGGIYELSFSTSTTWTLPSQILSTFKFTDAAGTGFSIKELNIIVTLPSVLSDLIYKTVKLPSDQAVDSVEFSTRKLEAAGCSILTAPLGILTYNEREGGVPVAKVRDSELYYIRPKSACGENLQDWQMLQNSLKSAVSDFCGGIAAIKCPSGYSCKLDGTYPDAGGTCVSNQNGTLSGHADVGPICPVQQQGVSCTPSPAAYMARQVGVFTPLGACTMSYPVGTCTGDKLVTSQHLDANGNYQFSLAPGTYVVKASGMRVEQIDVVKGTVTIKVGQTTAFNFSIDTGIR